MSRPSFLLVSDFDDTLKITHTTNRLRTVLRGLFAKQVYAGMPELYQEWTGDRPFVLISSSPRAIVGKIGRFLDRHAFPEREVWLRDWFRQKDVRRYKHEALRKLETRPEKGFIFVGDDAEFDPEVFVSFREANPDRTFAIYIRRVRGRPLPAGVVPFYSAFEIALSELAHRRLKVSQVARIGKAVADHAQIDDVVPYFAAAPEEVRPEKEIATLARVVDGVNTLYERIRNSRISKIRGAR